MELQSSLETSFPFLGGGWGCFPTWCLWKSFETFRGDDIAMFLRVY